MLRLTRGESKSNGGGGVRIVLQRSLVIRSGRVLWDGEKSYPKSGYIINVSGFLRGGDSHGIFEVSGKGSRYSKCNQTFEKTMRGKKYLLQMSQHRRWGEEGTDADGENAIRVLF